MPSKLSHHLVKANFTFNFANRFEADERIKFHIENITKKLRGECEERISELVIQHENEIRSLIKFYESGGMGNDDVQVMRDKCQREVKRMTNESNAGDDEDNDDDKLTTNSRECDEELSHYISTSAHHEQMRNTLLNLENSSDGEKMKNECLKAMDLQRELMLSRHITEIMHLIAILRYQEKLNSTPTPTHHMKQLDTKKRENNLLHDSIECNETPSKSYQNIIWKQKSQNDTRNPSLIKNVFIDSLLNRFHTTPHENVSTMDLLESQQKSSVGGDQRKSIPPSLETMEKTFAQIHPSIADVDDVLLPSTEASRMKNSLELFEKEEIAPHVS